jgi:hypothetical protein
MFSSACKQYSGLLKRTEQFMSVLILLRQTILLVSGRVLPLNGLIRLLYLPLHPVNLLCAQMRPALLFYSV